MLKTILIVEDYADTLELLKFALEADGYETLAAADGYEAIELAKERLPDLILMDASLPAMDGITATRELKTTPETQDIPIICLTAHDHYYHEKALEAGCDEVIGKPVNFADLRLIISRHLTD